MTTTTTEGPEQSPALSPGEQYVADFLPGSDSLLDTSWLAEEIDSSRIVVCTRCHFASLPKDPFPANGTIQQDNPGITDADCNVCAHLTQAMKFHSYPASIGRALAHAPETLTNARTDRAKALFLYWMTAYDGADALVWASLRAGLDAAHLPAPPEA